jgi:hypothetical protein
VATASEEVRLYASAPDVANAVVEPVLLALGARAGLDVGRLDELAAGLELAIASVAPGPVTADLRRVGRRLSVTVSPVEPERLRSRRTLLDALAASVVADGDAIALSLDA